ncbi:gluconate 2-dehydrogenase subunit 3 family protein [Pseudohongiella spirulinae]|uniref:Twin-arginine translocation pathway signal n=1 Tax=Pseudohongiella spirulinae TaxID=1249552 RepID=A0A0S2KEW0_9GAMM|nr:gluconate 2-dehydrogenase subunit 3 family protein [Pseudohongiella spirulinae]ALO46876.1 Twin-arginine translocation pathway signal [Pseudohongiella spirulinae]
MNRRELLKMISAVTGYAMIGTPLLLSGCASNPEGAYRSESFSADDIDLLAELAETIVPRTHTPGAKDAGVAPFMTKIVDNCYSDADQMAFLAGLRAIRAESQSRFGATFESAPADQRTAFLAELDVAARNYQRPEGGSAHYFTMIKQLTLFAYFTSELVQTQVLRHVPIPGRFDGCYPYEQGETAWAI